MPMVLRSMIGSGGVIGSLPGRSTGVTFTGWVDHARLPGLSDALFQRWLNLFRQVSNQQPNQAMALKAQDVAERIAWRNGAEMFGLPLRP